ncbi:MAG TPA: sulfotransferase [Acidimicrobiales bacterium]|nr:sulfotransferase [Acidimicrobiales bacterium]
MDPGRFDGDRLVEAAIATTGEDDFGEDGWREGLDLLLGGLCEVARLNDLGVEIAAGELANYLATRLAITAWRRDHPDVAAGTIERPLVIVGQPRTGTTILHDLLAQDPALRAPLTWEVDRPLPPPETDTYKSDPRIDEVQANIDMAESLMPGFTTFHPMGARLSQECVRITAGDFRSMIFSIQYRIPTYNRWLLHEADLGSAYRWHRRYLQHLQSRHSADQWLLKSPAHLWNLDALAAEYPDAIVIQTHRDPLKVIASTSALAAHLRGMATDETSLPEIAADYADDIFLGLDRGMEARDRATFPADQVVDVQFSEFVDDPFSTIHSLYAALGRELTGVTEKRMRAFLAGNPGDGGGGGARYRFADTGLDADELRQRSARYQERFGVVSEPVR